MRSRRRVRVSGARRVRAVIFCEGLRGLREHNGEVVGDGAWPAIIDRASHDRLVGLLDDPSRRWREPHLPSTCAHRGRAAGGVCGGLRIDQWRNPEAIKIAQSDWPRRVVYPTRVPGVAAGWVPMRCRECAAEVAAAARVCSRCGAPIVGQPPVVADAVVTDTAVGAVSDTAVSDAAGKAVPARVAGQAPPEPYVPGSGARVPAELRLVLGE